MIEFTWGVPKNGFHWIGLRLASKNRVSANGKRLLTPKLPTRWRSFNPFSEAPALFYVFSEIELTEEAILSFANKYGMLGKDKDITFQDGSTSRGEDFEIWQEEILSLQHTVRVWQAINAQAQNNLERWFRLDDHGKVVYVIYTPDDVPAPEIHINTVQFLQEGLAAERSWFLPFGAAWHRGDPTDIEIPTDPVGKALAFLRLCTNARLQQHTSAGLQYRAETDRMVPLGVYIVPRNLLGAIWLQFALAIEGNDEYRRCSQCQGWFRVPPKAKRANTKFCAPRCRVRAFRERKAAEEGEYT